MTRICTICDEEIIRGDDYNTQPAIKGNKGTMQVHKKCRHKIHKGIATKSNPNRAIFKKYGITLGQFYDMMVSQSGYCKICKCPAARPGVRLSIDHDHVTGKIRGLLCGKCNSMLGFANDNPQILIDAAKYLHDNK